MVAELCPWSPALLTGQQRRLNEREKMQQQEEGAPSSGEGFRDKEEVWAGGVVTGVCSNADGQPGADTHELRLTLRGPE